jgi:hypothetical protein
MARTTYKSDSLFIIQSLGESEIQTGTELYESLKSIRSPHINLYYHTPFTRDDLLDVLTKIKDGLGTKWHYPILHFECHGAESGIQLRLGEFLKWSELQQLLADITCKSKFNHLLVFGACFGMSFIDVIEVTLPSPCSALLASPHEVSPEQLANRFLQFYKILFNGGNASEAAREMNLCGYDTNGAFALVPANALFDAVYNSLMNQYNDPAELYNLSRKLQDSERNAGNRISTSRAKRVIIERCTTMIDNIRSIFLHKN